MLLQVFLGFPDLVVGMRPRQLDHRIARLPAARHAEQQGLGALKGDFVTAEFLHEIEAQIDRGVDAAAAEKPAVFRHKLFGLPPDLRIALCEICRRRPNESLQRWPSRIPLSARNATPVHAPAM